MQFFTIVHLTKLVIPIVNDIKISTISLRLTNDSLEIRQLTTIDDDIPRKLNATAVFFPNVLLKRRLVNRSPQTYKFWLVFS